MDFVVRLPVDSEFNAILKIVDSLAKMGYRIPCQNTCVAQNPVIRYLANIFYYYGLRLSIVCNHGLQYVLEICNAVCELLGIVGYLSTAYHPQIDKQ